MCVRWRRVCVRVWVVAPKVSERTFDSVAEVSACPFPTCRGRPGQPTKSLIRLCIMGAITFSREPYPHRDVWPPLMTMISAFGPERIMWGSDFTGLRYAPRTLEIGPRKNWYGLYGNAVGFLRDTTEVSESDKEQMFGGTIRRVLGWPKNT